MALRNLRSDLDRKPSAAGDGGPIGRLTRAARAAAAIRA